MNIDALFQQEKGALEDFWERRHNTPLFERNETLFGRPVRITSNVETVLEAVDLSLPLYSVGPTVDKPPFIIRFIVRDAPDDPGPVPENLFALNRYTGHDEWLSIQIGAWGHCHIDMAKGEAIATIQSRLAARPDIISHGLLNTIFNNLLTGSGFCMLHCSGLVSNDDRLLLLMAPHNTGKSTTALRLVLSGYQLLSDSQIYVSSDHEQLHLFGFPVGKAKLRKDMVPHFKQLHPYLKPEQVRDETKYSLDLRTLNPNWSHDTAFVPKHIDLCLLQRANQTHTSVEPVDLQTVWNTVIHNSVYYDSDDAWTRNLQQAKRVVEAATCYQLTIGTDAEEMVSTIKAITNIH